MSTCCRYHYTYRTEWIYAGMRSTWEKITGKSYFWGKILYYRQKTNRKIVPAKVKKTEVRLKTEKSHVWIYLYNYLEILEEINYLLLRVQMTVLTSSFIVTTCFQNDSFYSIFTSQWDSNSCTLFFLLISFIYEYNKKYICESMCAENLH